MCCAHVVWHRVSGRREAIADRRVAPRDASAPPPPPPPYSPHPTATWSRKKGEIQANATDRQGIFLGSENILPSPPPPSLLVPRPVSLHTAAIQNSDRSLLVASVRHRFFVFGFWILARGRRREVAHGARGAAARGIPAAPTRLRGGAPSGIRAI